MIKLDRQLTQMSVHPVHGHLNQLSVQFDHDCIRRCIIRIYESGAIEALTVKNRMSVVLYCRRLAFNKASYLDVFLRKRIIDSLEDIRILEVRFPRRDFTEFDRRPGVTAFENHDCNIDIGGLVETSVLW